MGVGSIYIYINYQAAVTQFLINLTLQRKLAENKNNAIAISVWYINCSTLNFLHCFCAFLQAYNA